MREVLLYMFGYATNQALATGVAARDAQVAAPNRITSAVRDRTDSLLRSGVTSSTSAIGTREHARFRRVVMLKSFSSSPWKQPYLEALKLSGKDELTGLVQSAEMAMYCRSKELTDSPEHRQERNELRLANMDLLAVKTHKLGWPALRSVKFS
jgi:hypothetical protein